MIYEWDEAKREANRSKHGIDFDEVRSFVWETAEIKPSPRGNEIRYAATGRAFPKSVRGEPVEPQLGPSTSSGRTARYDPISTMERPCATGYIGPRLHRVIYTERGESIRIISLRKAHLKEVRDYVDRDSARGVGAGRVGLLAYGLLHDAERVLAQDLPDVGVGVAALD